MTSLIVICLVFIAGNANAGRTVRAFAEAPQAYIAKASEGECQGVLVGPMHLLTSASCVPPNKRRTLNFLFYNFEGTQILARGNITRVSTGNYHYDCEVGCNDPREDWALVTLSIAGNKTIADIVGGYMQVAGVQLGSGDVFALGKHVNPRPTRRLRRVNPNHWAPMLVENCRVQHEQYEMGAITHNCASKSGSPLVVSYNNTFYVAGVQSFEYDIGLNQKEYYATTADNFVASWQRVVRPRRANAPRIDTELQTVQQAARSVVSRLQRLSRYFRQNPVVGGQREQQLRQRTVSWVTETTRDFSTIELPAFGTWQRNYRLFQLRQEIEEANRFLDRYFARVVSD